MKSFRATFVRGLIAIIPVTATVFLLVWLIKAAESYLGGFFEWAFPAIPYIPGMGVFFALIMVFGVGLALNAWIAQKFLNWFEDMLERIPLIKSIYSPMKDLIGLFSSKGAKDLNRVVMMDIGENRKIFGLVTRDDYSDLGLKGHNDKIMVYFPMSYQIGGYTVLVPKDQITEIDMPVDKALSLMVTGWVKGSD